MSSDSTEKPVQAPTAVSEADDAGEGTEKAEAGNYEVGYAKPPKSTRFKPGQCGNPKGRPKGTRNLTKILETEINTLISYTENGRRKKISKLGAAVRNVMNKAAAGDLRAFLAIVNETRLREKDMKSFKFDLDNSEDRNVTQPLTVEDAASVYREALKNAKPSK